MLDIASLADFHQRLKEFENGHALDLSSSEDLSIAVMNLISIEEHLFFTANKTTNHNYLHLLASVRQIRKTAQKALVKETVGEDWCTCKHLLAASMRLMETGNKLYQKDATLATQLYQQSWECYNLFWAINLQLVAPAKQSASTTGKKNATKLSATSKTATSVAKPSKVVVVAEKKVAATKTNSVAAKTSACRWQRFSQALNKNLDCCHE